MQRPNFPYLLAYKPVLIDNKTRKMYPESNPDWEWPMMRTVTVACEVNPKHLPAVKDCTCGVYLSTDVEAVKQFLEQPVMSVYGRGLFIGIFQVLGNVVQEGVLLRAQSAFFWGLVKPSNMEQSKWLQLGALIIQDNQDADPAMYTHISLAQDIVEESWDNYDIKHK
jgi:hypothetical protein